MAEQTTITKEEHFVLIDYYQNFIKNKEIEIQNLKKQLQFTLESKDENKYLFKAIRTTK